MPTRAELIEEMRTLANKAKELAQQHANIVKEFERIQGQIQELDKNVLKNSN